MSIDQELAAESTQAKGLQSGSTQALAPLATTRARLDTHELVAIFIGGVAGALLRVWLSMRFPATATQWPWATFAINLSGAFILGYLATRLQERLPLSTYRRPLLGTGFCGAYTTFSTMQVQALAMIEHGRSGLAVGYVGTSVAAGYLAVWVATATARRMRSIR